MAGSIQTLGGAFFDVQPRAGLGVAAGSANGRGVIVTALANGWLSQVQAWLRVNEASTVDALVYRVSGGTYSLVAASSAANLAVTADHDAFTFGSPSRTMIRQGDDYAIVLRVLSGSISLGTRPGVGTTPRMVTGGLGTGAAPATWTPAQTTGYDGATYLAMRGYLNVAPTAAVTAPAANASVNSVPTFTVQMTDSDVTDYGDALRQTWLHIVGDSGGSANANDVKYGPQATPVENADGVATGSVTPAISFPAAVYWYRMAATDRFGATSAFTAWRKVTSTASANVQPDTGGTQTPTAKIETLQTGFRYTYTNPTGANAQSVVVELYQGSTRVRQSNPIAVAWVPDTTNTVTWAQLVAAGLAGGGAWTDLQWGQEYGHQAVVTAVGGAISPASARTTFRTDAAPGVPATIAPKGGANATSRPVLRVTVTDVDDTAATGLEVVARIKSAAGAVLFTRAMTFEATTAPGTHEYRYQTTTADIPDPSPGTRVDYRWDASAFDGTLYSGQVLAAGSRTWSAEETFGYTVGPQTTITSLSGAPVFGTVNPQFSVAWQGANASAVEVRATPLGDPSTTISYWGLGSGAFTSPQTVTMGGQSFRDGQAYDFYSRVVVNGVAGESAPLTLTLRYPPFAPPLDFLATPFTPEGSPWPTLVQLSWSRTTYPVGQFVDYVVTARPEGEPEGSPHQRPLAVISDPDAGMCFDGFPISDVDYRYTLRQRVRFGNDIIPSNPSEQTGGVTLDGVVLSVAADPTRSVTFALDGDLPEWSYRGFEDVRSPFGGSRPVTWVTGLDYRTVSASFPLVTDPVNPFSGPKQRALIDGIRRETLCWRDRDGERVFFRIPTDGGGSVRRLQGGRFEFRLQGREEQWEEQPVTYELQAVTA